MKSGFSHFDGSGRENFCAAVLLLAMEVDDAVRELVARLVRERLGIEGGCELLSFGREAGLGQQEEATGNQEPDDGARSDLWLLFGPRAHAAYALVEVKTHNDWDEADVARQVMDQAKRRVTRGADLPVVGSVLLGPERLCRNVREVDDRVRQITWPQLLAAMRTLRSTSPLTEFAIRHLEEKMDRPPGLDRSMSLDQFEEAATTIACLREFLVDCIKDVRGSIQGEPMWLTPGDGRPRRGTDGWAWHGLSVPFSRDGKRGRIGIYRYKEAPLGEEGALGTLWLEAYLGDGDTPVAYVNFAPPRLSGSELDIVRADLRAKWAARLEATGAQAGP